MSFFIFYVRLIIVFWVFIEDFIGDGKCDLVIVGFKGDKINFLDLKIKVWILKKNGKEWS